VLALKPAEAGTQQASEQAVRRRQCRWAMTAPLDGSAREAGRYAARGGEEGVIRSRHRRRRGRRQAGAATVLCARYVSGRLRCRGLVKSLVVRGRAARLLRLAMEQVDKLRFGQRQ